MPSSEFLTPDEWLSRIMGKAVFSLTVPERAEFGSNNSWQGQLPDGTFIYTKVPTDDIRTLGGLEEIGFRVVDTNVTFQRDRIDITEEIDGVREVTAADKEAVVRIARSSFQFSRFHLDPAISKSCADEIKAQWVGNYFNGSRGNAMVVSEAEGAITGFNMLLRRGDSLIIDLIAVEHPYAGRGIGSALIRCAEKLNTAEKRYVVGTQVSNIAAMRLYEKNRFRVAETKYILHYHKTRDFKKRGASSYE